MSGAFPIAPVRRSLGEGVVKFLILISIEVLIENHSLQNSPGSALVGIQHPVSCKKASIFQAKKL